MSLRRRKIYFRADASAHIGYGHFIRTLALADMLKDNFDCTFFTQTPTTYQRSEVAKVCKLEELPATDEKYSLFLEYLSGDEIVVLDNYFFSTDYQRTIKTKGCRLVCIDDMHDKHYVADIVINHAIDDPSLFSIEPYTKLCLGLEWALLRKAFLVPQTNILRKKNHWLISFGGSDYYNLTEKYVGLIHQNNNVEHISVVIGDVYKYEDTLRDYTKVTINKNLSAEEMSSLMQQCEYAILPCSSICIEAISQGCKVYAGYYVDNQVDANLYLSKNRFINNVGNLNDADVINIECIKQWTNDYIPSFNIIPENYCSVFNGLSESYVYDGLVFIDYVLLPKSDHKIIWQNRNDDAIRVHMDSSNIILWEDHCRFISYLKNNSQRRYWAVYCNGELVGSVNISYVQNNIVERGIFVVPNQIGRSWGTKIEKGLFGLLRSMNIEAIKAKVLHSNKQSLYFHYKNGYVTTNSDDRYEYLTRLL